MKYTALTLLLCLAMGMPAHSVHAQGKDAQKTAAPVQNTFTQTVYSSIASDLPLMPGMQEKADTLVMFDTPEGRIAEISLDSPHGEVEVLAYYREALPALGWRGENPQVWSRGDEMLTIRFTGQRGVTFHLQPIPPSVRNRNRAAPNW